MKGRQNWLLVLTNQDMAPLPMGSQLSFRMSVELSDLHPLTATAVRVSFECRADCDRRFLGERTASQIVSELKSPCARCPPMGSSIQYYSHIASN